MRDERPHLCPHCGGAISPKRIDIHVVNPDGCRLWPHDENVRTRDTVGYGDGSLEDEHRCDVRTPWTSREHKRTALAHLSGDLLDFARALPYVRLADRD